MTRKELEIAIRELRDPSIVHRLAFAGARDIVIAAAEAHLDTLPKFQWTVRLFLGNTEKLETHEDMVIALTVAEGALRAGWHKVEIEAP